MAPSLVLRPYIEADRPAVLALFDANVPVFFAADERGWLEDSLGDLDGPALLVTVDGVAAAFGGYEIWDYYDKALLVWGMAHPRFHGRGLGRWLLAARLALIARRRRQRAGSRWTPHRRSHRSSSARASDGERMASRLPHRW